MTTPSRDPGWFFVIQQQPTEPRFGLDVADFSQAAAAANDVERSELAASGQHRRGIAGVVARFDQDGAAGRRQGEVGQELRAPGLHHAATPGAHRHSRKRNDSVKLRSDSCPLPILTFRTFPNTPEVGMPLSFGPARPVVLFPVRLETRFFPQADGSSELRVRVYPDRVHIDSHEPELTADELTWGQHFWEQTWRAANDDERGKSRVAAIGRPLRSAACRVGRRARSNR